MSDPPPELFDRPALARHRARAARAPALFLHEAAAAEIKERLKEVNRRFTDATVVAPFSQIWGEFGQVAADAEVLDLALGRYDLIIHALALHWSGDPVGQLIQCRRALRSDGLCIAVLFGGQTLHELRTALAEAETGLTGGLSPRVAPMGEIRDLGALLQRAGFALPVADTLTTTVEYRDLAHLARDLRAMGETNALTGRLRRFGNRALFERAQTIYARTYPGRGGRITATFEMIFLTGWAPGPDQPKSLRPGSAQARLADALGTAEIDPNKAWHS